MQSHIARAKDLPVSLRQALIDARHQRRWSQAELGRRAGLPQTHISGIETGKVVPRFDTLLEIVRVLDHDLLLVPRDLVPIVQSLTRDHCTRGAHPADDEDERPLYAPDEEPDDEKERPS
jgi:transcriptional regulator with XRE-family HTH domain